MIYKYFVIKNYIIIHSDIFLHLPTKNFVPTDKKYLHLHDCAYQQEICSCLPTRYFIFTDKIWQWTTSVSLNENFCSCQKMHLQNLMYDYNKMFEWSSYWSSLILVNKSALYSRSPFFLLINLHYIQYIFPVKYYYSYKNI